VDLFSSLMCGLCIGMDEPVAEDRGRGAELPMGCGLQPASGPENGADSPGWLGLAAFICAS
jgi:hypothetical protein